MVHQIPLENLAEKLWFKQAAKRAGITIIFPSSPPPSDNELGFFDYFIRTLEMTQAATGRTDLGLLLGQNTRVEEIAGNHGYVLVNAAETLRDFFEMVANYSLFNSQTGSLVLQASRRGQTRLTVQENVNVGPSQSIVVEIVLACFTRFVRIYKGKRWSPVNVGFRHSAPGDLASYQAFWSDRIAFSQKANFIEFDNTCLDQPINDIDPALLAVIRDHAKQLVKSSSEKSDLRTQLRLFLIENIGSQHISQDDLARQFGMSRSTLQRRLKEEGASLRQIRNEVIELLAKQMLSNTNAPISSIIEKLGFSEASAFSRAFSNLTGGVSPREYRKQARQNKK